MIKILKYILTALLFATLWSSAADNALMQSENVSKCLNELASEYKSDYSVFDTSDAELIVSYVSSQVYTSQNNARRTNIGQRLLVSFIKNGKLHNVSVCNNLSKLFCGLMNTICPAVCLHKGMMIGALLRSAG